MLVFIKKYNDELFLNNNNNNNEFLKGHEKRHFVFVTLL